MKDLSAFNNAIKGCALSTCDQFSIIKETIRSQFNENFQGIDDYTTLSAAIIELSKQYLVDETGFKKYFGSIYERSDPLIEVLRRYVDKDIIIANGTNCMKLRIQLNGGEDFFINQYKWQFDLSTSQYELVLDIYPIIRFTFDYGELNYVGKVHKDIKYWSNINFKTTTVTPISQPIDTIINDSLLMYGQLNEIATIIESTAGAYETSASETYDSWHSVVNSEIEATTTLTSETKTRLKTAAGRGPDTFLETIKSEIQNIKDNNDNFISETETMYSTDTHISFNNKIGGFFMNAGPALISTVGLVASVINPVVGAIVSGVGIALNVVLTIVNKYATNLDDTDLKISLGLNNCPCFDFAVFTETREDGVVADAILNKLLTRGITIYSSVNPVIGLLWVDKDDVTVHYEERLSVNFDASKAFVKPTGTFTRVNLNDGSQGFKIDANFMLDPDLNSFDDTSGKRIFFFPFIREGTILPTWRWSRVSFINRIQAYQPMQLGRLDAVRQIYSNELNESLRTRLASAIFLYLLDKIMIAYESFIPYSPNSSALAIVSDDSSGTITSRRAECLLALIRLFNKSFMLWRNTSMETTFNWDWVPSVQNLSDLVSEIVDCFDGLKFNDVLRDGFYFPADANFLQYYQLPASSATFYTHNNTRFNEEHDLPTTNGYDEITFNLLSIVLNGNDRYSEGFNIISNLPSTAAIKLPTISWKNWITGILFDGVCVVALIATTAVLATGYFKLKNKVARMQADTESSWYQYQDADPASKDTAWKAYKRNRCKYNLLASATGGTKLSLGLYDDSADNSGSVLSKMSKLMSGGTNAEMQQETNDPNAVSLSGIAKLITG